jgi:phosphoglycerate dehydrogenase-like enzyme
MTQKRILVTAPVEEIVIELLEAHAPTVTSPSTDQKTLSGLLTGTIGIVARGEARITPELVEAAPDLKVVGRTGVGYDNVDVPALTRRSIPLIIAPVGGFSVAEGALGMLLCLVKNMRIMDTAVRSGNWDRRYDELVGDVAGHTFGIVGLGRIGSYLARLLQPFEVTVLGYDPYVDADRMAEIGVRKVSLKELLAQSDYVSLHMLLNDETRGMIDREAVAGMKRGAVLLNLARGGITDGLDTLADALEDGQLSYVGLDVFPTEPPDVSHRIFKHPRCLFAPHALGMSHLAMDRVGRSMANDMLAVLEGKRPRHCVNPEVFG